MKTKYTIGVLFLIIVVFLAPTMSISGQENKYKDFIFDPMIGASSFEVRTKRKPIPEDLKNTYAEFFNADKVFSKGIEAFLEYQPGKYAVMGGAYTRDKKLMNRFTSCDFKGDGTERVLTDCGILIGIVDTEAKSITRINTPNTPELGFHKLTADGEIYGCYIGNPFQAEDLNLDGIPELFIVGGVGDYGISTVGRSRSGEGETRVARTSIFVYDVSAMEPKKILETELSYERYDTSTEIFKERGIKSEYQSYALSILADEGTTERVLSDNLKPQAVQGIRRYAKLYFKDFDKNNKLDILVWRREYRSRLKDDPVKGYKLEKVEFELYEESEPSVVKKPVEESVAENYLQENELTWRLGFPNKNLCHQAYIKENDPLIYKHEDPQHNIEDPVLEK